MSPGKIVYKKHHRTKTSRTRYKILCNMRTSKSIRETEIIIFVYSTLY